MLDNTFQRRRDIEHMLLSGKRLTVPYLMAKYSVGRNTIRRDLDIISETLPVISKRGYNGGYFLMDGVGKYQNSLTHEQLECLEELKEYCPAKLKKIFLSIIHEFGPYCEKVT